VVVPQPGPLPGKNAPSQHPNGKPNSQQLNSLRCKIRVETGPAPARPWNLKTRCNTKSTTYTRCMDFSIDRPQYLGVLLPLPPRFSRTKAPARRIGGRSFKSGKILRSRTWVR
jgi:hypothetical protein